MSAFKKSVYSLVGIAIGTSILWANPVSYTSVGSEYTEDFNSNLPGGAETFSWDQGGIFNGWYAQYEDQSIETPDEYRRTFGLSSGIRLYQWRANASATDGALGAIPINDTGDVYFAIAITNNTSFVLDQFSVGYTGQQWRITTSGPTSITADYQFGDLSGDLTSGTWITLSNLDFISPHSNADENTNVGGTLSENSEVLAPQTITDLEWAPGEELWIRFTVENITGFSQGLAIDNFNFTAVPEPAHFATIAGALVLFLCWYRRKLK